MNQDCQCIHLPNFNETCCIRHLLEMYDYAEDHILPYKYLKLFMRAILAAFKSNSIQYSTLKLDSTKRLLEILIKQMCHFFMVNNIRFSKLMVNVALDIYQKTQFKSQVDIIYRTSAVYNNVACMYVKTNIYNKAIMYFNHYKKSAIGSLDQLIYLNNVLMIYLKQNVIKEINETIDQFHLLLFQEIELAKKDNLLLTKTDLENNSTNSNYNSKALNGKCKLLSFLMYNYSLALEMNNKPKDAKNAFQKGYEFSVGTLGIHSFYTHKFSIKLDTKKKIAFAKVNNSSKGESSNVKFFRSKTPNQRDDFTDKINKNMDKIIERLDQFQQKINNTESEENILSKKSKNQDDNVTNIQKMNISKKVKIIDSNQQKRHSDFNKEILMKYMISKMQNIITDINPVKKEDPQPLILTNNNDNSQNKIDLLSEIVKEFEDEVRTKEKKNSLKAQSLFSLNNPKPVEIPSKTMTTNFSPLKSDSEIDQRKIKEDEHYSKPLKIKRVFQKILKSPELNPLKPQGKFAGMVSNLLNDNNTANLLQKKSSHLQEMINEDISFNSVRKTDNLIEISDDINVNSNTANASTNNANNNNINYINYNNKTEFGNALTFGDKEDNSCSNRVPSSSNSNKIDNSNNNILIENNHSQSTFIPKLDLVNQMNKLEIKIDLDETESKYSTTTFFQKNNIPLHPKPKSKKQVSDYQELFDRLVSLHSNSITLENPLQFIRLYDDITLIIQLIPKEEAFYLKLCNRETNLVEFNVEYTKMRGILSKMSLVTGLPPFKLFQSYQTIEEFSKYLIQYISIIKTGTKYKFGLSPNPIGIIVEKRIQFLFNKVTCLLDILITSRDKARVIIINGTGSNQRNFIIDCEFDHESFSNFVTTINHANSIGKKIQTHSLDMSQLATNGFIPRLSLRIQEILKMRDKDPGIEPFDVLYNENIYYKCDISNKLQNISTWINEIKPNGHCSVSYYTMKKERLNCYSLDISNNAFIAFFGLNQCDLAFALTNDKIMINQMLINSCDFNDSKNIIVLCQEKTLFNYSVSSKSDLMYSVGLFQMRNEVYARLKCFNTQTGIECKRILFPNSSSELSKDRMMALLQNETIFTKKIIKGCEELFKEDEFRPFDIFENVFY